MSRRAGQSGESAAATQTFAALTIDERVVVTQSRTIALSNIATVSVGPHIQPRSLLPLILAIVFATSGSALLMPGDFETVQAKAGGALLMLALIMAGLYFRPQDKNHYLLISTNDGVLSRFTGPRREMLDEVRGLLTRKINAGGDTSTFTIDFQNGTIESSNASGAHGTHASGTSHSAAANGVTAFSEPGNPLQAANGANGRVSTSGSPYPASPAVPMGNAPQQNGAAQVNPEQYVDFSHFLPAVVEMHRFYARQPNAEHLEQRLHELELLMRAGAPGAHQKARLRELAGEVSQILQAYPSAVQIFQNIGALTT